jgi:non-specific serine/threonine protein kinase
MLRFSDALEPAMESVSLSRQLGNLLDEVQVLCVIGDDMRCLGDMSAAVTLLEQCLALAREKLPEGISLGPIIFLSKAVSDAGDQQRARALLEEAVRIRRAQNAPDTNYDNLLDAMAVVANAEGDTERAVRLWAKADAIWESDVIPRPPDFEWDYAPRRLKARERLGGAAYEAAYAQGRAMTVEQAMEYALSS